MADTRPTVSALHRQLQDYRHKYAEQGKDLPYCSWGAVNNWFTASYPPAAEAARINALAAKFQGVDDRALLRFAAASAAGFIEATDADLNSAIAMAGTKPETILHNRLVAIKELRTAAIAIHSLTTQESTRELELAGAARYREILLNILKDTPQETVLREAGEAAMRQLEAEVR